MPPIVAGGVVLKALPNKLGGARDQRRQIGHGWTRTFIRIPELGRWKKRLPLSDFEIRSTKSKIRRSIRNLKEAKRRAKVAREVVRFGFFDF
jgi:hypothetical protein